MQGQQYLVTNLHFVKKADVIVKPGAQRIEFQVPADVNKIHGWLDEFDHSCSDKLALAIYIRSRLFYYYELKFDYQLVKELEVEDVFQFTVPTFADIADINDVEYRTVTVDIDMPTMYNAIISAHDLEIAGDIEQALFENMMHNMAISFNVLTLTDIVLETMADYMNEKDASCPDTIAQTVVDNINEPLTDHQIEDLYNAVHSLASCLVKEPGKYL